MLIEQQMKIFDWSCGGAGARPCAGQLSCGDQDIVAGKVTLYPPAGHGDAVLGGQAQSAVGQAGAKISGLDHHGVQVWV